MTAGRDDDVLILRSKHLFILPLDDCRTHGRLLHVEEAQLLERRAHGLDAHAVVIGDERRGQTDDHRIAAAQENLHLLRLIDDLLGVLRTHHEALPAQYALVAYDIGLIAGEANGLDGTVTNTLVTVLTVGFFQSQTIH